MKLFQFTGVNVSNISFVMLNNVSNPGWWLHASLGEFNVDGSVVSSTKSLIFSINFKEAQVGFIFVSPMLVVSLILSFADENVETQQANGFN